MSMSHGLKRYLPFIPRMIRKDGLPVHFTFFVTSRCNARCGHCFYWDPPNKDPDKELRLDEIERVAAQLGPLLWLAITGGEPFLREDVPEIAQIFHEHARPRHVTINTNGLLTDRIVQDVERAARLCPESYFHVQISLDAADDSHDRLRGTREAVPRVLETAARVGRLRDRLPNIGLGIGTAYTSITAGSIEQLMDLVENQLRPDHWDISLVRGDPRDPGTKEVDEARFWQLKRDIESRLLRGTFGYYPTPSRILALAKYIYHNRVTRSLNTPGHAVLPCYSARLSVVLNDVGDLFACETRDWKLGNLREDGYDFGAMWDGPRARAIRDRIDRGCTCDQGCNLSVNLFFNPALYPAMLLNFLDRSLQEVMPGRQ